MLADFYVVCMYYMYLCMYVCMYVCMCVRTKILYLYMVPTKLTANGT